MFDPLPHPRVFGMEPGVDFPAALVAGLRDMYKDRPPQDLARVRLIVNTRRMARRIRDLFDQGAPTLLPRIDLITDLGQSLHLGGIPNAVPALRRRLELVELIAALLESQPDLAPRTALYDLADSLAKVLDEMQGEGVSPEALEALDVSDLSGHWARALTFLTIARRYSSSDPDGIDPEARQRLVIERTVADWVKSPPVHPVILAGSTGSRGSTHLLMNAVARLPQGAVILPGYDFGMPDAAWATLSDALTGEDHPQFRFARLLNELGMAHGDVKIWSDAKPPAKGRNELVSLALRPAPVTHQWMTEGPNLTDLESSTANMTLVEAPSGRAEALAIAMRLRQAAHDGVTAALITPDRMLTRQVSAALDRWDIVPDDSAGQPLQLSPPGRFLRHVSGLFTRRCSTEALLTILKHPLAHSGAERGPHLLLTRALELRLRRNGPPFPSGDDLREFAASRTEDIAPAWANWVAETILSGPTPDAMDLNVRVATHLSLSGRIAQGHIGDGTGELWAGPAGRSASETIAELEREAGYGGALTAHDYETLFNSVLAGGEVRERDAGHSGILIWGTLEARVQGADLVILGGLNEGSWPEVPPPDPWLNREMRHKAGLLLPERKIGLSAHDFQQAVAAPEVWLTRSVRSQDSETVPSRWVSRMMNLLDGLPGAGEAALASMRARGQQSLAAATTLEQIQPTAAAPRPAPCPPVSARPRKLSVTEIQRLVRDPYAIYARRVLRLEPLDPLMSVPDALLRGIVLHRVLELFIRKSRDNDLSRDVLLAICDEVLDSEVPWAEARHLWRARLTRVCDAFLHDEEGRRTLGNPIAFEVKGHSEITDLGFTLTAKADRIDIDPSGNALIYDYKTGAPPSKDKQIFFDRQLLLSAALADRNGFDGVDPKSVVRAAYIGLGSNSGEVPAPLDAVPPGKAWSDFDKLIRAFFDDSMSYTSRRAMFKTAETGNYDQLARFGEWDATTPPHRSDVR